MAFPARDEAFQFDAIREEINFAPRASSRSSLKSSLSSRSLSSSCSSRSISWSEDEDEIFTVSKITKSKEKDAYWLSKDDYKKIRSEAVLISQVQKRVGSVNEDFHTLRGLEKTTPAEESRLRAARKTAVEEHDADMYRYLSSSAVKRAQSLAAADAKEAKQYQEEITKQPVETVASKKKPGLLKTLARRK